MCLDIPRVARGDGRSRGYSSDESARSRRTPPLQLAGGISQQGSEPFVDRRPAGARQGLRGDAPPATRSVPRPRQQYLVPQMLDLVRHPAAVLEQCVREPIAAIAVVSVQMLDRLEICADVISSHDRNLMSAIPGRFPAGDHPHRTGALGRNGESRTDHDVVRLPCGEVETTARILDERQHIVLDVNVCIPILAVPTG